MAHAQKLDFVFRRNGRVHLNRRGRQFSRLLAAEVCVSAVVMLGTPCFEVVWKYWLPTPFASFPFTFPPVCHRVPSHFNRTLPPALTFRNYTFCPHSVFTCFVWIWEQTATCATYSINWLVFISETMCVFCAVRTGSLNKAVCASYLKG